MCEDGWMDGCGHSHISGCRASVYSESQSRQERKDLNTIDTLIEVVCIAARAMHTLCMCVCVCVCVCACACLCVLMGGCLNMLPVESWNLQYLIQWERKRVCVCAGTGAAVMIICDRRLCVWDQSAECRAMSESLSAFCGCCWEVKGRGVRAAPLCNWGIPRVSALFPLFVSSRWLLFEKIACAVIK